MLNSLCHQAIEELIWYLGREQDTFAQPNVTVNRLEFTVLFCNFDCLDLLP